METPKPFDYRRAYQELSSRVRALESGNPFKNASIGNSGGMSIGAADTGEPILYVGAHENGGTGFVIRRQSGSLAFAMAKGLVGDPEQSIGMYDKNGNAVVGDSALSFNGADRPSLANAMRRVDTTEEVTITSTTFVDVFEAEFRVFNGFIEGRFQARVSAAGVAGEVRLADTSGAPLGIFFNSQTPVGIPAGATTLARYATQSCVPPGSPAVNTPMVVRVQARVSAGSGSLILRPGIVCGP